MFSQRLTFAEQIDRAYAAPPIREPIMSDTTRQSARDQRAADQANTTANDAAATGDTSTTAQARADQDAADKAAFEASQKAQQAKDTPKAPPTDAEKEEADRLKAEQDAQAKAEQDKAKRAKDGVTGDPSGNPAGVAFAQRIADAKFTLRNQGHTEIEALLDEMMLGLQRLEGKFTGG
jgi:membrane protein involved in colicin uptake